MSAKKKNYLIKFGSIILLVVLTLTGYNNKESSRILEYRNQSISKIECTDDGIIEHMKLGYDKKQISLQFFELIIPELEHKKISFNNIISNRFNRLICDDITLENAYLEEEVAFYSERNGKSGIFVQKVGEKNAREVTTSFDYNDSNPAWSPDGRRIAFHSQRYDNLDIFVMNSDGSAIARLTNFTGLDGNPCWSPDGKKIAFHSARSGGADIYIMDANGSNVKQVTKNIGFCEGPHWSPSGKDIVFFSDKETKGRFEIYLTDTDGKNIRRLTHTNRSNIWPRWSPDGKKIAFASEEKTLTYGINNTFSDIFVMNAEGSNLKNLTADRNVIDTQPTWSPDGKRLAFSSTREDFNFEIFIMDATGGNINRLTYNLGGLDGYPAFCPY